MECLAGDFQGDRDCISTVVNSGLDVFAHNIETVERLTPGVRDRRAKYRSVGATASREKLQETVSPLVAIVKWWASQGWF